MITRKLFLVVIAGLMLATTSLFAGPFYDDNFVISTKKTDFICTHFGDGYQSYIEDPNGFVVVWSTAYQAYVYAVKDANGYLVPSSVPIGGSPPAGKHLRISGTALTNYNQQVADWSTSLDDTPTVDDDHLFVILVDFLDQSTSSYNGGTKDLGDGTYYDVELMYNSFFAEGYIGDTDAYDENPSDKGADPQDRHFFPYGSVRQYFREISYYSSPMGDTPSLIRDDYDMAPQSNYSSLDNFFTTVPLDDREMYFVPGFLNPVVYDDVARQWHFLYYNLGATIYDPEINDYVDATAENVQNIIKGQAAIADVIDNALLQARSYGFDIDIADIGYDQDEENKIHMVYAEDNEGWGFHNYGRYSWAQEEKKVKYDNLLPSKLIYDHIYYHAREIGQNIFKLADTGHNHYKWDGSPTDLYAHFNWGIGPYDIMNGHLFAYNDDGTLTALEKFNAHANPPHPSPANKVLKDMVEPIVLSNVDNTFNVTPYATTGNVYLIEDPNHPVSSANNYSDAEYLLVCNRSFPCDGSFAATDSSFENFWEKYFRGLDIYHVDWSDNDPDRRKAYQAEVDHREIQNVLLDNTEGDGSDVLQYFHYFDEDLMDVFFDLYFGSNPWSRDWNDGGQNGGGPSFINLIEVIDNTTYFSFEIDALMSNPCIHPELVVPTVIGGVEDPNFYLGTTLPYKSYEFWVNNYSYISSPTFTVTVAPENASIVEVDDNTDQHTFVGPLQADGSDSFTPFNMRMISDTESLIGSEVTLDVTYSPDYPLNVDEINIPVSYPITDGYPQVLSNDQACRGNLIAFDLDNDGADEFIGFSDKDLMVFRGSSRFSETVSTSAIYRGVAVGNILPDDTQVLGGDPGSGIVEYQPEILVLYWDYLNSRTTIKLYSFDPSSGLDLLYTYHETGTTGPLSQPVLGNIYSNGLHDLIYCVENHNNGCVRARRFDGSTMEEIWTFSPENGYCDVGQGRKPLVADFDLDGLKEVAVCVYSEGPNNEFLGDGYRVIKTNGHAANGYTEIPVEAISGSVDATKGYRTTGVAADFDMDDTLEIAVQWGEWGSLDPVHTSSKIGVLDFNGESFDLHTTTNNYAFNGEMMVADISTTDGPEILAGVGWYADPSITPDNEIISFRYTSGHSIQENSYWDWENETGTPFSMIAGAFPSSNDGRPHVAGIVSGEEGEYSQIHIMASDGNPAFGNSSTNSTLNAKGSEVVYESGYNPNAAIACSDNESNNQSLMVWTDRMVYKYSDNSASQVAGLSYWPMKYHDAQNSSVYDTVAVPDSIVFANGTTLEGSLYFKGDATVSEGDTVYILPGTRIHMMSIDPDDRFHVYGTLMAEGTLENAISFISGHVDTTGGILFHDTCLPNSKLQHIEFNDFKYALEFDGYVETSLSREINNLDFTDCKYGLYANNSSIVAYNIEFAECYNSIKAIETHVIIDTCNIVDPGVYGIYLQGNSSGVTNTYSYLYNVEIDGEGATSCFATIYAFYLTQCVIEDLRIEDAYIHGIYTGYSSGVIRDSFILSSGNTGLVCFNSGIDLDRVVINDSEQYGVLSYGTSSPVLEDCAIVNNDNIQYYSTSGSLPVIDDHHNDIYREAGNTNYLIRNNGTPMASIYYCENNYWGPSTPTSSLFSINRLGIDYNPWDTTPNVPTISTAETDTFMLACNAELDGEWDLAKERFQWIIQNSTEETQRLDALSHWVNLGSTSIDIWEEKENQLNTWESTAAVGTEFYNGLEDAMARCYVGQKRHADAIEIYSNRYHNATTFSDSALAEIHINNIYVDMAYSTNGGGGRSTSSTDASLEDREELKPQLGSIRAVHNTDKLKPSSLTKAEKRVRKLMDLIASGKREETSLLPKEFKLASPYPNPFNPTVAIPFEIPKQAEITIAVYNVLGQRVSTLVSKPMNAGYHKIMWNGKDQYGTPIASGVYFVKMSAPNYIKTRKIVMLK